MLAITKAASRRVRLFSTYSYQRRHQSFDVLQSTIKRRIAANKGETIEESTFIKSIQDILDHKSKSRKTDIKSINSLLNYVIEAPNFRIQQNSLKKLFLLGLPVENTINLIESFYSKNPSAAIPKSIAMIPFRQMLWDADVNGALKIIDLTTGSKRYISHKKFEQGKGLFKYFGSVAALIGVLDLALRSLGIQPMIGMYAMFATYVLNMSFFASMSFSGKIAGKSDFIQFTPGVPQTYRILHLDEMLMLSRAAEVDAIVNGDGNLVSAEFSEKINEKNLQMLESKNQLLIQEYWLSGGDNFEWVEPDQDPAELLWKNRLQYIKPKSLKADTNWTERLIEPSKNSDNDIRGAIA